MRYLSIDLETYSSVDIAKGGVYKYTEAEDFEILLIAYAFDDEEVQICEFAEAPDELKKALVNPEIIKTAFNAVFEITSLCKYFTIDISQWQCTAVKALTLGLPASLNAVAKCFNLQKLETGKSLIKFFSCPNKKGRNYAHEYTEKWEQFKEYCKRDVEVERAIRQKLETYKFLEKELWILDYKINSTGIKVDVELIQNAIECYELYSSKLKAEIKEITKLDNPNSVAQLKKWFEKVEGIEVPTLSKDANIEFKTIEAKRVLAIRKQLSKTSIKKYTTMINAVCRDGRVRGLLQFYGANRTGRWAGRLVQVHNLPRNYLQDLDTARNYLKNKDYDVLEMLYNIPDLLSQLIRTAFIGNFVIADFSAIEARVISWLADEKWRNEVFAGDGKIYEASASKMFHTNNVTKELRQKGKVAELALGYQGSVGALIKMGALNMGIKEEELEDIVSSWRNANSNIVKLWYDVEKAAIDTIENYKVNYIRGLVFSYENNNLFIKLPSGRRLCYANASIKTNKFERSAITYHGLEQTSKQFTQLDTYGGKLVENIVQGIARDCLAVTLLRLSEYKVVMHVHDEVIVEDADIEEIEKIMCQNIDWAPGLILRAEAFQSNYYKK